MLHVPTYNYASGNQSTPNRQIQFVQGVDGNYNAHVYKLDANGRPGQQKISAVGSRNIEVERDSRMDRIRNFITPEFELEGPIALANLTVGQQQGVLKSMQSRHVTVINSSSALPTRLVVSALN